MHAVSARLKSASSATCASSLVVLFVVSLAPARLAAQNNRLIDFELEDQFDVSYRTADFLDRVVVVIGSDRAGSAFNDRWGTAIGAAVGSESVEDRVEFVALADLTGVPRVLRRFVRSKFPNDREAAVLLDWDGQFASGYAFQAGASNILVFARDGTLVHRAHGRELNDETLHGITASVMTAVRSASPPPAPPATLRSNDDGQ